MPLIKYDPGVVAGHLLAKDAPVMETTLIRELASRGYPANGEVTLFTLHFSLFHALYSVKSLFGREGYYLHIDTMRIRLLALPQKGCPHYDVELGEFCGGEGCCAHELESGIFPDFFTSFYLDEENINYESMVNREYINALIFYGYNKRCVDEALRFFGVVSPEKNLVQAAYRRLAKQLHPDHGGSEEAMKILNSHFSLLKRCFV